VANGTRTRSLLGHNQMLCQIELWPPSHPRDYTTFEVERKKTEKPSLPMRLRAVGVAAGELRLAMTQKSRAKFIPIGDEPFRAILPYLARDHLHRLADSDLFRIHVGQLGGDQRAFF
jgi:hypothetical protein